MARPLGDSAAVVWQAGGGAEGEKNSPCTKVGLVGIRLGLEDGAALIKELLDEQECIQPGLISKGIAGCIVSQHLPAAVEYHVGKGGGIDR